MVLAWLALGTLLMTPPAHWTDAQIHNAIDHSHMTVLAVELQTAQCPVGIPHLQPVTLTADPYEVWLTYVAAHLRTGAAFGNDYAGISAPAKDEVYNIWFDCAKHIHDVNELQLRADETPEQVGRELLAAFSGTDASSHQRAAAYLLSAYR